MRLCGINYKVAMNYRNFVRRIVCILVGIWGAICFVEGIGAIIASRTSSGPDTHSDWSPNFLGVVGGIYIIIGAFLFLLALVLWRDKPNHNQ